MPPKKDAPKSAAKKGKSEEPKKGGKDEKKCGRKEKEPPAKGKGKDDGKKGKKPVSKSEESSEEEEEVMTEVEDDDDSDEEVVTMKVDKTKGKAALKGASKAMAMKGFKPPSKQSSPPDDEEEKEETKGKTQVKKGMGAINLKKMSDVHIKGASKAMMGFAAEGQKKNVAAAKAQKTTNVRSHLKGASKAVTGLTGKGSPFGSPPKQQQPEKAKPKRNFRSTSHLFLRLSKKKKPAADGKPLLGTGKIFAGFQAKSPSPDKKPNLSGFSLFNKKDDTAKETPPPKKTINLSSLGDKGKMAAEAKGLGGKFKGMFGKKKAEGASILKKKSWMLGRIAAATNWLTGRFLTTKGQSLLGARAGERQRKSLSFANRGARGRQTPYYNDAYECDDDEYGYEEDYHSRLRPRGYQQPMAYDPYDPYGEEIDYYEDDEWEDEYGYYDDEGNFYYDDEFYYEDADVNYHNYPYGYYNDEYEEYYGDEGLEYYYGEDGMLYAIEPESYSGFYDPELYVDYFNHNIAYNYGMSDPNGMITSGYDVISDLYNDPVLGYTNPAAIYNPYQQPFYMDAGLDPAEMGQIYGGQEQMSVPLTEPFRVPRPHIRLFGEKVDTLPMPYPPPHPPSPHCPPPSPALALTNLEMLSDLQYGQPLSTNLPGQLHYPTVMKQQQVPILPTQAPLPTAMSIQQEHFSLPQPTYPPLSVSPTHLSTSPLIQQPSLPQDPQVFQMGQISPIRPQVPPLTHSALHPPGASPRLVRQMNPILSPQLSLRTGSVMAPPSSHLSPNHMDFQRGMQMDPHLSSRFQRSRHTHQNSVTSQRPPCTLNRQRPPSPVSSQPHNRRGMSVRGQPSLSQGRGDTCLHRATSTAKPQSPLSSPLASPRGSLRRRASPPPSPRSFRQKPPPDAVSLASTKPHVFNGRKQTSKMRYTASPPLPSPQRQSPPLPDRCQSPPQTFRPTSPHCPSSPSSPRISRRPLPTRSSTRRLRGRNHVPMGAVKPSPANPYLQRHSRHGAPITQHVAPFRSSLHSGPAHPSGQTGGVAGSPMLARTGSHTIGLRESKQIGSPQGGFHRPIGRGQPLVRMPRNQSSLQSRQSFRAAPKVSPLSPQPSLNKSGPLLSKPSVRRLQSGPLSPQQLQLSSPLLSHPSSHQPPFFPQNHRPTSIQTPIPHPRLPSGTLPPSHSITQHDYTLMDPGPSPMLTNAVPNHQIVDAPFTPLPHSQIIQSPYMPTADITSSLQRSPSPMPGGQEEILADAPVSQEVTARLGLSNALMQNSHLRSATYSSPLQRNANLYTTVLSPPQGTAHPVPSVRSSPNLSSAMLTSQLRNAPFVSPLQRQPSPMSSISPAPPAPTSQQGTIRGTYSLLSNGLCTSQIQGSMYRLPGGTLKITHGHDKPPVTTVAENGVHDGGGLSPPMLSNALQNPSLRQATYQLPDGSLVTRAEPAESTPGSSLVSSSMLSSALLNPNLKQVTYRLPGGTLAMRTEPSSAPQPSSPMLSSALLNSNVRKATYRLPDGTLVTRSEPEPSPATPSSSMLSSALLNRNVRNASYQLPDASFLTRPVNEAQKTESSVSSPGLSTALMNANLRKAKFQLPDGSSLFSRNQTQAPTSPLISGAMLNTDIRSAHYSLPNTSLLRPPGSADTPESRSLDLSKALRNQTIQSATYRLPDGTLITHAQPAAAPQTLDLSNALSKNPKLRAAKYCLPDGNIMTRLGAPSTPEPSLPNLSGALQNPHLRGASFRLPSYAVVSPQVQGSGAEQHWAQGPGIEGLGLQQDGDVWSAERVLPHGTVQNLNKWSMCRDGELLDPHTLMGQGPTRHEPKQWNLSREGEPQGHWFDKVKLLDIRQAPNMHKNYS